MDQVESTTQPLAVWNSQRQSWACAKSGIELDPLASKCTQIVSTLLKELPTELERVTLTKTSGGYWMELQTTTSSWRIVMSKDTLDTSSTKKPTDSQD